MTATTIADKVVSDMTKEFNGFEDDVTTALRNSIVNALSGYYISETPPKEGGGKKAKKDKKPRPMTAYNVFMKEKMQEDEIQALEPKARLTKIGQLWKSVTDDEKAEYKKKAESATEKLAVEPATESVTEPAEKKETKKKAVKKEATKKEAETAAESKKEEPKKATKPKKSK